MILSASINLFDGEELLPAALRSLRAHVEHVSVVYQRVSNRGAPAHVDHQALLDGLVARGLVDDVVLYDPDAHPGSSASDHERRKRRLGLELAARIGASHFLSADVDEFYLPDQFHAARRRIEREGWDGSACRWVDYHRAPTYRVRDLPTYHGEPLFVPFIYSVAGALADEEPNRFRLFDGTRALPCRRPCVFAPDELLMHHMRTVRRDRDSLARKFANQSTGWLFETPEQLADLVLRFDPAVHGAPPVIQVEDAFGIDFEEHPQDTPEVFRDPTPRSSQATERSPS